MKGIKPLAGKLSKKQKPVGKGIPGLVLDASTAEPRVEDDGTCELDHSVATREEPHEGITLFSDFERRATAEALIEETLLRQRALAKCHVGTKAQTAESGNLEPVPIVVANGAWALLERANHI